MSVFIKSVETCQSSQSDPVVLAVTSAVSIPGMRCRARDRGCRGRHPGCRRSELGSGTGGGGTLHYTRHTADILNVTSITSSARVNFCIVWVNFPVVGIFRSI